MAISDRDLTRPPSPSSFGLIRIDSISTRMVLTIVAAFFLDRLLQRHGVVYPGFMADGKRMGDCPPIVGLGYFSAGLAFVRLELWRCLTWPLVHVQVPHLVVNLIGLHFFGPVLEDHYGTRRFIVFYILCSFGGLLAYVAMLATHQMILDPWVPIYGATAPVLGILVAAAHVAPNTTTIIYGVLPMKLRTLALVLLVVTVYAGFAYGGSAISDPLSGSLILQLGGSMSHLGGAAVGLLLVRSPQWVKLFSWNPFRRPPPF